MDFSALLKIRQAWSTFAANHPKFPAFIRDIAQNGACENMEIAIAVRYPDGTECKAGIKVKESDLELLELLKTLNQ